MDNNIVLPAILWMQNLPAEAASILLLFSCVSWILILFRLFGKNGLYVFSTVAILAANIQVLKGTYMHFSHGPTALGTVVFCSVYLCNNILTEHYGAKSAQDNIKLCLLAQVIMTCLMLLAIGHKPLSIDNIVSGTEHMLSAEQAINTLFIPSPRLSFSSLIAFYISQSVAVFLLHLTKKFNLIKYSWIRSISFLSLGSITDTILFNLLAWRLLSTTPASLSVIFYTYILWTLIAQLIIVLLASPITCFSYIYKPSSLCK